MLRTSLCLCRGGKVRAVGLLTASLLLASCGGGGGGGGGGQTSSSSAPTPAPAPSPSLTASAASSAIFGGPGVALSADLKGSDAAITWQLNGAGSLSSASGSSISFIPPSVGDSYQIGQASTQIIATAGSLTSSVFVQTQPYKWRHALFSPSNTTSTVFSGVGLASDGTVFSLDSTDLLTSLTPAGDVKWTYQLGTASSNTVQLQNPVVTSDGTVYAASYDHQVFAISSAGSLIWKVSQPAAIGSQLTAAVDGTVYVSVGTSLSALNGADGTTKWTITPNASAGAVSVLAIGSAGQLYISGLGYVEALDPSGSVLWTVTLASGSSPNSAAIGADGSIYFGVYGSDSLVAVSSTGTPLWTFTVADRINSGPVIGADNTIYFAVAHDASLTGTLYALHPDGSLDWSKALPGEAVSHPLLGANGSIFISYESLTGQSETAALNPDGSVRWTALSNFQSNGYNLGMQADGSLIVPDDSTVSSYYSGTSLANSPWPKYGGDIGNTGHH